MQEDKVNILQCPCNERKPMKIEEGIYCCQSESCQHSASRGGFISTNNKPVIINFQKCDTVCNEADYSKYSQTYIKRGRSLTRIRENISRMLGIKNRTKINCGKYIEELKKVSKAPRILIIGSGTIGNGADLLYQDDGVEHVGIDIYPSITVDYIADAHYLPFKNECFDGVWIQAVLEHVIRPADVLSEISRVLKGNGLIYSEIPFMQQVHEGAYDFQRYTPVGHVSLYSNHIILSSGILGGPGDSFAWSSRYLIWALCRSRSLARILAMPLFWLMTIVDHLAPKKYKYDNCTGSFVLAQKPLEPYQATARELIKYYEGCQR